MSSLPTLRVTAPLPHHRLRGLSQREKLFFTQMYLAIITHSDSFGLKGKRFALFISLNSCHWREHFFFTPKAKNGIKASAATSQNYSCSIACLRHPSIFLQLCFKHLFCCKVWLNPQRSLLALILLETQKQGCLFFFVLAAITRFKVYHILKTAPSVG